MTPSIAIGVVCCPVSLVPGPGTGVVTGAAETWFSQTGPSLSTLSLLICVSDENPWLPRLPAPFGKSLSAGAQHDDRSAAAPIAEDDAAIARAAASDDAMRIGLIACILLKVFARVEDRATRRVAWPHRY